MSQETTALAVKQPKALGQPKEIMQRFQANPTTTLQDLLETFQGQIAMALPRHMTPERMIRVTLTALSQTPRLRECNPLTICGAVVQASILGLEPNAVLGEAFLVPYWNKKAKNPLTGAEGCYECQLQVGYKGHVKLSRNSGEIAMIDAQIVYENDEFDFDKGMNPVLLHKWAKTGTRGAWIGAWAGYRLKDGTFNFEYMTKEEIELHRDQYTKSRDKNNKIYGTWIDNPEWMWKKTVLIKALKLAPKSVAHATAFAIDEACEAGIPQRFSVEVPTMLNPPSDDDSADGPPEPVEQPKRASESKGKPEQATLTA